MLPEPLREFPNHGETYWFLGWRNPPYSLTWGQSKGEEIALAKGMRYATEADDLRNRTNAATKTGEQRG